MQSDKYAIQKVSGVIIGIGKTTEIEGYTETVLEAFISDDIQSAPQKEQDKWTSENNKRMTAICKFLNEKNL